MKEDIQRLEANGWVVYKLLASTGWIYEIYAILVSYRISSSIPIRLNRLLINDITNDEGYRYILLKYFAINNSDIDYATTISLIRDNNPLIKATSYIIDFQRKDQDHIMTPIRNMRTDESDFKKKKKKKRKKKDTSKLLEASTTYSKDYDTRSRAEFNKDLMKANIKNQLKRNTINTAASLGASVPFNPNIVRR